MFWITCYCVFVLSFDLNLFVFVLLHNVIHFKSKGKIPITEEEKLEMPTLKKVTRISKDTYEEQETVNLKKVYKPSSKEHEEPKMVYAEATTKVLITESYGAERHFEQYEHINRTEITRPEKDKVAPVEAYKEPEKAKTEDKKADKSDVPKIAKIPKQDVPEEPGLALKKVKKLPPELKEQETVKLKPFEKPGKPVPEPTKDSKNKPSEKEPGSFQKGKEPGSFEKGEKHQKADVQKEPEVTKKTTELPKPEEKKPDEAVRKLGDRAKKDEQAKEPDTPLWKGKRIPKQDEEPEKVQLKPFTKKPSAGSPAEKEAPEPKERQPLEISPLSRIPKTELLKEPKTPQKDVEIPEKEIDKKLLGLPKEEEKKEFPKKVPPVKKEVTPKKEEEKKPLVIKKGSLPKEPEKEEVILKPIEAAKKVLEPKKSPSPKVTQTEPTERKQSVGVAKKPVSEKVSPKDSIESVILKKVPKKISPQDKKTEETLAEKGSEEIPLIKELSPEGVLLRKISTQMEEEAFEEEMTEVGDEEEDEAWEWEVSPQDSYASEDADYLEEGALEAAGIPGGRRGERMTVAPHQ